MKHIKLCLSVFLALILLLSAICITVVFAADSNEITLIESGKTIWQYQVTTTEGFRRVYRNWYQVGFDTSSWNSGVSPFGDRLSGGTDSGWEGDNHGIFLVTTFEIEDLDDVTSLSMNVLYDNDVKIYLNGSLVFSDESWNDEHEVIPISTETLAEGKNTFAVSLLDNAGGREFDLTLTASSSGNTVTLPENKTQLIAASETPWRYLVTTTEGFAAMDANWKNEGYSTASWQVGTGPFGDCINGANSDRTGWKGDNHGIFLVTTFEIDDLDNLLNKYYYAELFYDNTITIYLNGTKVYDNEGWSTSYEEIALPLRSLLKAGTNTLAVSLLDDVGGREFDMSLYMTDRVIAPGTEVLDSELEEAGLPILRINTESGDYIRSRVDYVDATMVFENLSAYPDEDNIYTAEGGAAIEIRGRGNSTWNNGYPDGKENTLAGDTHTRKVGYNVKLDKKTNLFGMGKSKKWVLLANYMDRTNLRNKLIFDLSGRMGMTYSRSVYVNLVLNGEYMGVYALCQKVDIDLFDGAVTDFEDFAEEFAEGVADEFGYDKDWQSDFEDELCENLSWLTEDTYKTYRVSDYVDLSDVSTKTGYLIEYDGYADEASFFYTEHGIPLKVSNLEGIKSNPTVFEDLKAYFSEFEEALFSDTFYNSKGKHYSEYLDMQSFVDYFILNTLILNVEFGYKSMYMVLGEDGKLQLGPCWDYDWSSGNPFLGANGQYDQWYNDGRAENNKWYREAYGDPWFMALVRERWATLGDAIDDMINSMDFYEEYLLPSTVIEYRKFNADSYERDFKSRTGGRSFSEEVDQLRTFLINRVNWLDTQFAKRDPNVEGFGMKTSSSVALALSGNGIGKTSSLFDYAADAVSGTSATLSITSASRGTATVYLNGILYATLSLENGVASAQEVSLAELDNGVNAMTVYCYDTSGALVGTNYLTLEMPGEKQPTPTLGSFLPEPEPDTPLLLSTDSINAYMQTTEPQGEKFSLRVVFVADEDFLDGQDQLSVRIVFDLYDGGKRSYNGQLSSGGGDYHVYRSITAQNDVYLADTGDLLFGNCIFDIPVNIVQTVTVTVTDTAGETVFTGSSPIS